MNQRVAKRKMFEIYRQFVLKSICRTDLIACFLPNETIAFNAYMTKYFAILNDFQHEWDNSSKAIVLRQISQKKKLETIAFDKHLIKTLLKNYHLPKYRLKKNKK